MYYFFVGLQVMSIVVLAVGLAYVFERASSKQHTMMLLLFLASFVNNIGYLKELLSTSMNEALSGTRICYVGKSYIPVIVLLLVADYCGMYIHKWIERSLLIVEMIVMLMVLTCTNQNWFYTNISYTQDGIFPHLILTHGIGYYMFMFVTCTCFAASLIMLMYRYSHARRQAERDSIPYLFAMIVFAAFGLVLFLLGVTGGYDTTAPAYCVSAILIMYSMVRYNILDTVDTAKSYAVEGLSEGIIVVDGLEDPVYANRIAAKAFPNIIKDISSDNISKGREYSNYLKSLRNTGKNLYVDDNVYKVLYQSIIRESEILGGMYILHDISDGYHYTERLEAAVEEKTRDIESIQHFIISSFASIVEARDDATGEHIKNTVDYVRLLVEAMLNDEHFDDVLDERTADLIIEAAPLHDIGKIWVSDVILNKPGKLNSDEFEIMKQHSEKGAKIINDTLAKVEREDYIKVAHDMALYHHEKWDGSGYPKGLKDLDIPISARIMAIADVYDALRSERCYKKAFSPEKARSIIKEGSGNHFDPVMVDLFLSNISKFEPDEKNDVSAK